MVVNLESQNELFLIIGKELKKRVECYAIGESAMIYHGAKRETKDIDLVFSNERDQKEIVNLLKRNGFKERLTRLVYIKRLAHLKKQSPIMLEKDEFSNLFVKIISPEDIILLKCATERAGDRIDALELIKLFKINWDIIINESVEQTKLGENIFPVFLYDFLLELKEDLKAEIPNDVLKKLMEISEKELSKRLKK